MRATLKILVIGFVCALASPAGANNDEVSCNLIVGGTTAATDISGGAITTTAFPTASAVAGRSYPRYAYLMLRVDLIDASNGITKLRFTFTESAAFAGTYRAAPPFCSNVGPVLTCGSVSIDWNPQTYGKNFTFKPIDWGFLFGKITVTATGAGALDTVGLEVYGCTE